MLFPLCQARAFVGFALSVLPPLQQKSTILLVLASLSSDINRCPSGIFIWVTFPCKAAIIFLAPGRTLPSSYLREHLVAIRPLFVMGFFKEQTG